MLEISSFGLSVSIFLILYGVFMFLFSMYSIFNVYHLVRYGFYNFSLYLLVSVYLGGTILLVAASAFQMLDYNWSHPLQVQKAVQFYNDNVFPSL